MKHITPDIEQRLAHEQRKNYGEKALYGITIGLQIARDWYKENNREQTRPESISFEDFTERFEEHETELDILLGEEHNKLNTMTLHEHLSQSEKDEEESTAYYKQVNDSLKWLYNKLVSIGAIQPIHYYDDPKMKEVLEEFSDLSWTIHIEGEEEWFGIDDDGNTAYINFEGEIVGNGIEPKADLQARFAARGYYPTTMKPK